MSPFESDTFWTELIFRSPHAETALWHIGRSGVRDLIETALRVMSDLQGAYQNEHNTDDAEPTRRLS